MDTVTPGISSETRAASFAHDIKRSTAALHLHLESQVLLSAITAPSVTSLQYCFYLALMKKIEEAYEREILPVAAGLFEGFEMQKASQLLSDDLDSIGNISTAYLLSDYVIPKERITLPFALGFMYVMEGSKLGGKVIYKHIHRTLGYSASNGAKFIADYGADTFGLWKVFLSTLSMYVTENDCAAEAIKGAEYAFSSIYDFFEANRATYEIQGHS